MHVLPLALAAKAVSFALLHMEVLLYWARLFMVTSKNVPDFDHAHQSKAKYVACSLLVLHFVIHHSKKSHTGML